MQIRPEFDARVIGQNLRRLRKEKKLSAEYVRDYLCFASVQAVYKQERGECFPQADTLLALMLLYNADIRDIVGVNEVSVKTYEEDLEDRSSFDLTVSEAA